jgi:pyruvate/2-oxoglutarate/acetoin dehydrogenase E1 component
MTEYFQAGLRPICEFMTFNFSMQAIDQVVYSWHLAKNDLVFESYAPIHARFSYLISLLGRSLPGKGRF